MRGRFPPLLTAPTVGAWLVFPFLTSHAPLTLFESQRWYYLPVNILFYSYGALVGVSVGLVVGILLGGKWRG